MSALAISAVTVTDDDFALIWNAADSRGAAAFALALSPESATVRASRLRALGVPLKKFQDGRKPRPPVDRQRITLRGTPRIKRMPVVAVDVFRAAWNAADSPAACASAIGWTLDSTKTRAARLRKAGVAVKLFGRGGPRPRIERPAPPAKTDAERARPKPSSEEWARDYPPGLVCCAGAGCTNPVVAPKVMCSLCVPGALERGMLKTLKRGAR